MGGGSKHPFCRPPCGISSGPGARTDGGSNDTHTGSTARMIRRRSLALCLLISFSSWAPPGLAFAPVAGTFFLPPPPPPYAPWPLLPSALLFVRSASSSILFLGGWGGGGAWVARFKSGIPQLPNTLRVVRRRHLRPGVLFGLQERRSLIVFNPLAFPLTFSKLSLSPVRLPQLLGPPWDANDERAFTLSLPPGRPALGTVPRVSAVPPLFLCDILGSTSPPPFCRASHHRLVSSTLRSELPRSAVVPTTCTARTPPLRTASRSSRRSARKQRAPRRTSSA